MNAWRFVRATCLAILLATPVSLARAQVAGSAQQPGLVDMSMLPPHISGQPDQSVPFALPGNDMPPKPPSARAARQRMPARPLSTAPRTKARTAEYQVPQQSTQKPQTSDESATGNQQAYYFYPATKTSAAASPVRQVSHQRDVASPTFYRVSQADLFQAEPQVRQTSHTRPYRGPTAGCPSCTAAEPTCEPGCAAPTCDRCGPCFECDAWIENDCMECRNRGCRPYRGIVCRGWCWSQDLALSIGMHTFESPADQGINGNYGFGYGLNWAMPVWHRLGLGAQIGYRGISADPVGEPISGTPGNARQQDFLTVGFFHRPARRGCWQYGVVWDWLNDNYYVPMQLSQIRGELSRSLGCCHDLGVWATSSVSDDSQLFNAVTQTWQAQDQFNIFLRTYHDRGIVTRLWGGATSDGDGLVGGDAFVPLSSYFALRGNVQFLLPHEGQTAGAFSQEAWAMSFNLVFYPAGRALQTTRSRYAPMLNVADNGSFLLDRVAP